MNNNKQQSIEEIVRDNEMLRDKLQIAEDTLDAIKSGSVDAIAVNGPNGPQVYTLEGADHTYKTIVERMGEGAVIINKDGLIIYCNAQFARLMNSSLSHTIGIPFNTFVPEDYQEGFSDIMNRVWKDQVKTEFILHSRKLEILPVYISLNTIDSSEGEVIGMTITDLSDQKERKNLESLFVQAPAIINLFRGPDHIFEMVHPHTSVYLNGKNAKGMKARDVLKDIQDPSFFEMMDAAFQSGKPFQQLEVSSMSYRNNVPDGKELFFNISYQPWFDIYKNVQGLMTYAVDVTEQVKARRKVEQSAKQFETLLESIHPITWSNLPCGKVTFYNQRWYEYIGLTAAQAAQTDWRSILHPDDVRRTIDAYMLDSANETVFELENRLLRASDKMYRWHLFRAMPIRNDEGKVSLWVGTATDIHDQKTVSEKITAINFELSNKNDELRRINSDLDNFVYTASHDLKAPVANIEGLIAALNDTLDTGDYQKEEVTDIIELINDSILRFKETISDLTEITKIQKNHIEDSNESIDCMEVIGDVMLSIQSMIDQTKATIILDLEGCDAFYFSKRNFKSIIYNLLSNAIKYRSFDRKPEVHITIKPNNKQRILTVRDNGLGMDLQNKESRIFSMFSRLHDHVEGSGIGLYLVKRIMDNTGGTITVDSEIGKGTTFTLCFNL